MAETSIAPQSGLSENVAGCCATPLAGSLILRILLMVKTH